MPVSLILASTSRYRAELLRRLNISFEQIAPDCDESPFDNEPAAVLVERLAIEKAVSVAKLYPQKIVIGSDQVAWCGGQIIGKPGDHTTAVNQLSFLSGKSVEFHTGLCVMQAQTDRRLHSVVTTTVAFKSLSADQIERYLRTDQPYDCAASFRSEGYGSAIADYISSDDPSALIGLPVITVANYLSQLGIPMP